MEKIGNYIYSWERTRENEYDSEKIEVFKKAYSKWIKLLNSQNVEKKCIAIINDLLDVFNEDDHIIIEDLYEAINREV